MTGSKGGAPAGNQNAAAHGLYARAQLTRRVTLPERVEIPALAEYAQTLGDAALAIAQGLLTKMESTSASHKDQALIGLYASVAQELFQVAAELEGVRGIKAASLGALSDSQFETLMHKERLALEIVLSQCLTAWKRIQDREEIQGDGLIEEEAADEAPHLFELGRANPVLKYLAAHMRSAKRMMREMAANLAWREQGMESDDDLGTRLITLIEGERSE